MGTVALLLIYQQLWLEVDYASRSRRSKRHIPLAATNSNLHNLGLAETVV